MKSETGLLFVLPALIVLFLLVAYPVAYTGLLSVTDNHGALVGIKNFGAVLKANVTTQAFVNTIWWVLGSVVFQVTLGVATAVLLNQNFHGRAALRTITLIPWVIPWMFHTEFGIINYMLTGTSLLPKPIRWLTNGDTVLPVLIAINVWKLFPFVAVMVLAGLQSIPNELYEAAQIDGANFWGEVWHIMLPSIRPLITAVTLLLVIWALNSITIIYAITKGGPANKTLITPIQIFRLAFENVAFNQAAALSVMFFAAAIVIVLIYMRVTRNQPGEAR
jgi:multiple sugar transport system permease protein